MKEWFSLSEIAGSPNMPTKPSGVRRKAERECWEVRDRKAVGGGKEYHLAAFPEITKDFLISLESTNVDKLQALIAEGEASEDSDAYLMAIEAIAPVQEVWGYQKKYAPNALNTVITNPSDHVGDGNKMVATLIDEGSNHFADAKQMAIAEPVTSVACEVSEVIPDGSDANLRLQARYFILKEWAMFIEVCTAEGGKKLGCDLSFVDKVKDGSHVLPDWVRKGISSDKGKILLSRGTIHQWQNSAEMGAAALRPNFKGKEGQSFFDKRPDYCLVAEALCREFGASVKNIHYAFATGLVKEDFGLEDMPTESQVSGWLKKRKETNNQRARAFETGDMTILRPSQGSYSRGLKPNQRWEVDSTKADATVKKDNIVWLQSRYGEAPVRCALIVLVDAATRMIKILCSPTSNGEGIIALTADGIRDWGLPEMIVSDNGKDYIGNDFTTFCRTMNNIKLHHCTVRQPMQKPHVERINRSLQHSAAWEMLPFNTGHNVAQQIAYRKRREGEPVLAWDMEAFQSWINKWVEDYHNRVHSSLGCTPYERLAAFRAEGWIAKMPANLEANLEFALMREKEVTLRKDGITYQGRTYIAPELIALEVGTKFGCRFNPQNVNQIYVYTSTNLAEAKFVCIATWSLALSPEDQAKIASIKPVIPEAMRDHEKAIKNARKRFKTATEQNPERLLPDRGGIAALRATELIESATDNLVKAIEAAANKQEVTTDDPEIQAKRKQWIEMQAKKDAEKEPEEEIRTGHDWRRIWGDKDRSIADTEWLLQTVDLGGFGNFVGMIEKKSVDEFRELLEKELEIRVA